MQFSLDTARIASRVSLMAHAGGPCPKPRRNYWLPLKPTSPTNPTVSLWKPTGGENEKNVTQHLLPRLQGQKEKDHDQHTEIYDYDRRRAGAFHRGQAEDPRWTQRRPGIDRPRRLIPCV